MPITFGQRGNCNVCEPRPRPRFADLRSLLGPRHGRPVFHQGGTDAGPDRPQVPRPESRRAHSRTVSLQTHWPPLLFALPRRPAGGGRVDDRLVDGNRDAEGMESPRPNVRVAVAFLLNARGGVVTATEGQPAIRAPPVRFAD